MTNILFIVGSTRKNSFNRQLAKITEKLIAKYASNNCSQIQVSYLDFNDVPFFVGTFKISTFNVSHDVHCVGFNIEENEPIFFIFLSCAK